MFSIRNFCHCLFSSSSTKNFRPNAAFFFYLSSACAFFASGFRYAATRRAIPLSFRVNVATSIATARDLYITQFLCMCNVYAMRVFIYFWFYMLLFLRTLHPVFSLHKAFRVLRRSVFRVCVGRKRLSYRRARLFRIESEMVYTSL